MTQKPVALLYEMLRSFAILAEELNLSRAVVRLGSTRQTVRRHITQLQEVRGETLFELDERHYVLTPAGKKALTEAHEVLGFCDRWIERGAGKIDGLDYQITRDKFGVRHFRRQHRLIDVNAHGTRLIRDSLAAWVACGADLTDARFAAVRPYCVIFRKIGSRWICVEFGAVSSFATWFGRVRAASSVGLPVEDLPGGQVIGAVTVAAYDDVLTRGTPRYEHMVTDLRRDLNGSQLPISFQRLFLPMRFPDESDGIASIVCRSYALHIEGVDDAEIRRMSDDLVME